MVLEVKLLSSNTGELGGGGWGRKSSGWHTNVKKGSLEMKSREREREERKEVKILELGLGLI